jgi:hypothetical protein
MFRKGMTRQGLAFGPTERREAGLIMDEPNHHVFEDAVIPGAAII